MIKLSNSNFNCPYLTFLVNSEVMTEKCRPEQGLEPRVPRYTYERSTD